ncbi:MAG: DUF4422 domain-containing protein [Lachnospiraceae bacterium]|nr:DUF4422 domain-containing protein [Lachnospiraceae bacterium]
MDTRIFICTHKPFPDPGLPGYIPLHVGSVMREDLGYARDDEGDNISSKNASFCELTGLYHVWKNVDCDIVGICHYRRYFVENGAYLTKEKAEKILTEYDVILPSPGFTGEKNLWIHYEKQHKRKDMQKTKEIVLKKYPSYEQAFEHVMNCNLFSLGNMIITKKQIFDEYCSWLFDILFAVEKETDLSGYDTFQARLYGYLSERLLRMWLMMHKYRVIEVDYKGTDPAEQEAEFKQVGLVRKFTDSVAMDIVSLYQGKKMQDLIEDWPSPDFGGRTPVFLCGKADEEWMDRLRGVLPADTVLIRINSENYSDYAYLPEHFVCLSEEEQKELIRAMVLYRYGGFWIGTECLLPRALPAELPELSFFSIRKQGVPIHKNINELRWSTDFLYAKPGSFLMGFLMNSLCYFRFRSMEKLPFSLTDCLLDCCLRHFPEAEAILEAVPFADEDRAEDA